MKWHVTKHGLLLKHCWTLRWEVSLSLYVAILVSQLCCQYSHHSFWQPSSLAVLAIDMKPTKNRCSAEWCFFIYTCRYNATGVCSSDVNELYPKAKNNAHDKGIRSIGSVRRCLLRRLAEHKRLTDQYKQLLHLRSVSSRLIISHPTDLGTETRYPQVRWFICTCKWWGQNVDSKLDSSLSWHVRASFMQCCDRLSRVPRTLPFQSL